MQDSSKKPNFKGLWCSPEVGTSLFDFFIEKSESFDSGAVIEGYITDRFGHAAFSGYVDKYKIQFTKRYSEEARRGPVAAQGEIHYEGCLVFGKFEGTYKVMKGEDRITNSGTFVMQEVMPE